MTCEPPSATSAGSNLARFRDRQTVSEYANYRDLQACETYLFEKYVPPGMRILDLGVGCGRTSQALASGAATYVGIDYSPEMIEVCRKRYPSLDFHLADAADLGRFQNESFDIAVFAFNGLDYLISDETRRRCLREVYRVLAPGGRFIFSAHNARCIFPVEDPENARERADRLAATSFPHGSSARHLYPDSLALILRITSRASLIWESIRGKMFSGVFWRGEGYFLDPVHGGLVSRASTPEHVAAEMIMLNFQEAEVVSGKYPRRSSPRSTAWYYYVFQKRT